MQLCGNKDKLLLFEKLFKCNSLTHAYLFFGEAQVGKFTIAKQISNIWDKDSSDTLIIEPDEKGILGIDQMRTIKRFVRLKPLPGKYRTVILNDLQTITDQAQNAILKIVEEPPISSIIIGIITNIELLPATLCSRFQKIYFPRVTKGQLSSYAKVALSLPEKEIEALVSEAHGRPGKLLDLVSNKRVRDLRNLAKKFVSDEAHRTKIIELILNGEIPAEEKANLDLFFEHLIVELYRKKIDNMLALKNIHRRMSLMKQYQTNKKLQLEALANIL